ncbi:MAG: hypothetical protein A9Z00_01130 [Thermobacillus sp. ZCTH02-B1]|uniref:hypothetical protein n=1 Tax=Thermobacillus sp. ZCTH02-B1 TaxID=1858795 RepID=UPI000B58404D|nr:hypothetical protein [Thermobacillus sp. ZCTH02-B1]OUM94798.1 MAG: hypothetical protein A9Z00_01130 [Thermobacillus sp. ZCTH02-B1]
MGVRYGRAYGDILRELADAVGDIGDGWRLCGMDAEEWAGLEDRERRETLEAIADDVLYGLGARPVIAVGAGKVAYRPEFRVIVVSVSPRESRIVRLD